MTSDEYIIAQSVGISATIGIVYLAIETRRPFSTRFACLVGWHHWRIDRTTPGHRFVWECWHCRRREDWRRRRLN
jgi:hypothetical protein